MTNPAPLISEQGWKAELSLAFTPSPVKTIISSRKQRGPLAIQRAFYPEGKVCHAYVLHPPGGVVGGDQLAINMQVANEATALLTTPGATKFYRSDNRLATQHQHFKVANGSFEWLPQENIFFPGASSALTTHIELSAAARFIGWEVQCLGRPANGETFDSGSLSFKTLLFREHKPLYIDQLKIQTSMDLQGAASLRGKPVLATLLATPATPEILVLAREICNLPLKQGNAGITLFNEVLVLRYLGDSTAEAHQLLRKVWTAIRPHINGHPATPPRIWAT